MSIRLTLGASLLLFSAGLVPAQNPVGDCPSVRLDAPDHSYPWNSVRISAKSLKSPVKGEWLVAKRNYRSKEVDVFKIVNTESIEITGWQTNDSGLLTAVITVAPSAECKTERYASASVHIFENGGSPLIMDQFAELTAGDQKVRLDNVASEMQGRPEDELLIFLSFRKIQTGTERLRRVKAMLSHLSGTRKLQRNRITFFLREADTFSATFQSVSREQTRNYTDDGLVIPAENLSEFQRLFRR